MLTVLTIVIMRGRDGREEEAIAPVPSPPHIPIMDAEDADLRMKPANRRRAGWMQIPLVRHALVALGFLLIALTPLVGPIPGPGGIIVFGAGLSLILKYTGWAKRLYVRFKRKHPNKGRWADWSLRRASARRREALHRAIAAGSVVEGGREQAGDD
jgi:hypothetical protein